MRAQDVRREAEVGRFEAQNVLELREEARFRRALCASLPAVVGVTPMRRHCCDLSQ
jgi:hypothetical protein